MQSRNGKILMGKTRCCKQRRTFQFLNISHHLNLLFTSNNKELNTKCNPWASILGITCTKRSMACIILSFYLNMDKILYCILLSTAGLIQIELAIKNYLSKLDKLLLIRFCISYIQQRKLCI